MLCVCMCIYMYIGVSCLPYFLVNGEGAIIEDETFQNWKFPKRPCLSRQCLGGSDSELGISQFPS